MCINIFFVVICQKSFWNVVDWFHEGYSSKLIFSPMSWSPASMTRDFSFNWHLEITCGCFLERAWKVSSCLVPFSTSSSNLIWAELGTYSFSVFSYCWLEIYYNKFWCHVMKSAAQQITIFVNLSWSVTAWKLAWYQSATIGDLWVCFTVTTECASRSVKWVLFCLPSLSYAFPLDILVSLSLDILQKNLGVARVFIWV